MIHVDCGVALLEDLMVTFCIHSCHVLDQEFHMVLNVDSRIEMKIITFFMRECKIVLAK